MSGEIRRPGMRGGLRRGMGVCARGGRGGPSGPPPVVDVVGVVADRGGPSGRGRGRGGRVIRRNERPGPSSINEIEIVDISQMPRGQGLATALHPKKRRMWQPSNLVPPPPPSPIASPSPVTPPSPVSFSVPSPAMFVECVIEERPAPRRPPPHLLDADIASLINYGSDEGSDESDDEEQNIIAPVIPRVFRSLMETPLDQDPGEGPAADTASAPAPSDAPLGMTEQPWGLLNFDWRAFPDPQIPPELRREPFSEMNVGPTTPHDDPYSIFIEIWDRPIMEHMVSETNKYAQQVASQLIQSNTLRPTSPISRWYETTVDELYTYFAIILAMGIVVKTRLEEYWDATSNIFHTPGFSTHMSIDRFIILSKCLHFNDNDDMCALELEYSEARLFKIQPILLHLNNKFQQMYTPSQDISLDESLLQWKGWLEFCQLSPNKAANRGIKTYEICESQTGYLWRFEVHANKRSQQHQDQDPLEATTPATVLRLVQGLEYKGYTLWMDNFYNSPSLARRLKCLGFDCVGTLRTDRKFVPQVLTNLTKHRMRQGQITGLTSGDVDVMVWRDANRVAMISTYHGTGQQTARGSTKPILISDYNIMMGGVDKKDQLLAMYPVERKRTRVWYKKFFRRLLNISILNAYIIHNQSTSSITHRNFRIKLITSLLSRHSPAPPLVPPAITQYKADVTHRLAEFPMGNHLRIRRACSACKKLVRTYCVGCSRTACMGPCFLTIHS